MNKEQAQALWNKYLKGEATEQEQRFIEAWYNHAMDETVPFSGEPDWDAVDRALSSNLPAKPKSSIRYRYVAVAAALLLTLGIGYYFYQVNKPMPLEVVNRLIVPGGNKAILTLADGTRVHLSSDKQGVVVSEGITYDDGSALLPEGQAAQGRKNRMDSATPLKLSTPAGGQYQVTLSDGTQVWLNASSSLSYPATFEAEGERIVTVTGEAYFEVAHDAERPFKVRSRDQTVQVLGTHFNVNAYEDEPSVKTTLLEGQVAVILESNKKTVLAPNEQSVVVPGVDYIATKAIDPSEVIDWKNGDFTFNNESIESIMRKIARWYDVEVVFQGEIPPIGFGGTVSRSKNITEVLQILELTGAVHFKFEIGDDTNEERRIIVMP